jgi:hypothetical protein
LQFTPLRLSIKFTQKCMLDVEENEKNILELEEFENRIFCIMKRSRHTKTVLSHFCVFKFFNFFTSENVVLALKEKTQQWM